MDADKRADGLALALGGTVIWLCTAGAAGLVAGTELGFWAGVATALGLSVPLVLGFVLLRPWFVQGAKRHSTERKVQMNGFARTAVIGLGVATIALTVTLMTVLATGTGRHHMDGDHTGMMAGMMNGAAMHEGSMLDHMRTTMGEEAFAAMQEQMKSTLGDEAYAKMLEHMESADCTAMMAMMQDMQMPTTGGTTGDHNSHHPGGSQ